MLDSRIRGNDGPGAWLPLCYGNEGRGFPTAQKKSKTTILTTKSTNHTKKTKAAPKKLGSVIEGSRALWKSMPMSAGIRERGDYL